MKVTELEVGKVYKKDNSGMDYILYRKNIDGIIERLEVDANQWSRSQNTYNQMIEADFTEYEEPVDWSKVEVDTKILVRDYECDDWRKRHFAKFEDGNVYSFENGTTYFTSDDACHLNLFIHWNYAKLYKEDEDGEV